MSLPAPHQRLALMVFSENPDHRYILEILDHAGLVYQEVKPAEGPAVARPFPIWIALIHGRPPLDAEWVSALRAHVQEGGGLLLLGAPLGLEDLFQVRFSSGYHQVRPDWLGPCRDLGEGYAAPSDHPIVRAAPRPLHVFGGAALEALPGGEVLAGFLDSSALPTDTIAGALRARSENLGPMVCWAVDLIRSVVCIQQGVPVVRDGVPAPDGSAPLDDNILKAEDGLILDWTRDRARHEEAGFAFFDIPVADHLRQWLISSILWVAQQAGIPLPRLGYFPKGTSAIAHLSLDTDGNDPDLAGSMLSRLKEHGVRATWCNILPCYPQDSGVFERLRAEGHEIALHFDSGSDPRIGFRWSREEFLRQYHQVCQAAGVDRLFTNKNHYTRWEGGTELFEWCAEMGIQMESTRGPSKPGTIGFPFGSCHPWFPLDRFGKGIDCLEFPFLTQDPVVTVPACVTGDLHRAVRSVEGIAHFLFHPAHIRKPGVAEALSKVVTEGKSYGAEWWTAAEISAWERRRRAALETARKGAWSKITEADMDWKGLE